MSKQKSKLLPPRPSLLGLVELGNVDAVRNHFDESFLSGRAVVRPTWEHLRAAIEAYNIPMAKLLVTWGAQPIKSELEQLVAERGESASKDILCLRLAGANLYDLPTVQPLSVTPTPLVALPIQDSDIDFDLEKIPAEWKHVLATMHALGAPEALIAGGALRDLYNEKPIKDVDIFLSDRWMTKSFIKKIFAQAGLVIHSKIIPEGYGMVERKIRRGNADAFNQVTTRRLGYGYSEPVAHKEIKEGAEAWTISAGPNATEYNIVFVKGALGKELRALSKAGRDHWKILLCQFDMGLCQISFDGSHVKTRREYDEDVEYKKITLWRPNNSSHNHIERVMKKYPDFKLCDSSNARIELEKKSCFKKTEWR